MLDLDFLGWCHACMLFFLVCARARALVFIFLGVSRGWLDLFNSLHSHVAELRAYTNF